MSSRVNMELIIDAAVTRRLTFVLMGVAFVLPPVALLAPLALAPFVVLAGAAAVILAPRDTLWKATSKPLLTISLALLGWGLITAWWAPSPTAVANKIAQLLPMFAGGIALLAAGALLLDVERKRVGLALAAGMGAALALVVFELAAGTPISKLITEIPPGDSLLLKRYSRGLTVMAILLWPTVLILHRAFGSAVAAVFPLACLACFIAMGSRSSLAAALLGGGIFLFSKRFPRGAVFAFVAVAGMAIVMPFVLPGAVLDRPDITHIRNEAIQHNLLSSLHRLRIWEFTITRIQDRPIIGWGLDASRSLPGGDVETDVAGPKLPLHPHNAVLQIQVELGALGIAFSILLLAGLISGIMKQPAHRDTRAALLAAASVGLLVCSLSYGIWQSWWIGAMWLTAALSFCASQRGLQS